MKPESGIGTCVKRRGAQKVDGGGTRFPFITSGGVDQRMMIGWTTSWHFAGIVTTGCIIPMR